MISCTSAEFTLTRTTLPTRIGASADPVTTGWSISTPSSEPLLIVIVKRKFDRPFAITTAGMEDGVRLCFNPISAESCSN